VRRPPTVRSGHVARSIPAEHAFGLTPNWRRCNRIDREFTKTVRATTTPDLDRVRRTGSVDHVTSDTGPRAGPSTRHQHRLQRRVDRRSSHRPCPQPVRQTRAARREPPHPRERGTGPTRSLSRCRRHAHGARPRWTTNTDDPWASPMGSPYGVAQRAPALRSPCLPWNPPARVRRRAASSPRGRARDRSLRSGDIVVMHAPRGQRLRFRKRRCAPGRALGSASSVRGSGDPRGHCRPPRELPVRPEPAARELSVRAEPRPASSPFGRAAARELSVRAEPRPASSPFA
jgi:hypothetical protein